MKLYDHPLSDNYDETFDILFKYFFRIVWTSYSVNAHENRIKVKLLPFIVADTSTWFKAKKACIGTNFDSTLQTRKGTNRIFLHMVI